MSYCTIDQVKAAAGEDLLDGGELDASVYQFNADVGAEMIDEYCDRSWSVVVETRRFDAADGPILVIDDAVSVTSVVAYGGAPLGTSLYRTIRDEPDGPIVRLERAGSDGGLIAWTSGQSVPPFGQVAITATWAAAASPPKRVILANTVIAVKLVKLYTLQYTTSGGGGVMGLASADDNLFPSFVTRMLDPLRRAPVPVIRGTPLVLPTVVG